MDCIVRRVANSQTQLSGFQLLELGRSLLPSCFSVPRAAYGCKRSPAQACSGVQAPASGRPPSSPPPSLGSLSRAQTPPGPPRPVQAPRSLCSRSGFRTSLIQPGPAPHSHVTATSRCVSRQHHSVGSRNERQGSGKAFPTPLREQATVVGKAGGRLAP